MKGRQDKKVRIMVRVIAAECAVVVVLAIVCICISIRRGENSKKTNQENVAQASDQQAGTSESSEQNKDKKEGSVVDSEKKGSVTSVTAEPTPTVAETDEKKDMLDKAELLAMQYDYDKAINMIKDYDAKYEQDTELADAVKKYEAAKGELKLYGAFDSVDQISHVFFHSLIADTDKAFDGDRMENGYNYWMTTVNEFKTMLKKMYEDGFVLVSIHDIGEKVKSEDGKAKFIQGKIMLPKDKKPFVLSQDDVNYYDYMQKDGFAKRLVIDENGYPACEIELDGKKVIGRDYDVVPILEKFIEEHPDFSYHGARGIIGVTGYEGVIGYRTNNKDSKTYKQDVKDAKAVADRLKEIGWEFASHSYGHRHMGQESTNYVLNDAKHWESDIGSIVGKTDIYLFPYGEDVQDTIGNYDNDKVKGLEKLGFRYFCGVYAYPWIQVRDHYVRMTRRNLDGYSMHFHPERMKDLFNVDEVIDKARPAFK